MLRPKHGSMYALIFAGGEGVGDENFFKNWFQHIHQRVVYDPVPEIRDRNSSVFGVKNIEITIRPWLPCSHSQGFLQQQQLFFQIAEKQRAFYPAPAATAGLFPSGKQVWKTAKSIEQVIYATHDLSHPPHMRPAVLISV